MDGVMLEASGHEAAVVATQMTEDCVHRGLIEGPELMSWMGFTG